MWKNGDVEVSEAEERKNNLHVNRSSRHIQKKLVDKQRQRPEPSQNPRSNGGFFSGFLSLSPSPALALKPECRRRCFRLLHSSSWLLSEHL